MHYRSLSENLTEFQLLESETRGVSHTPPKDE